MKKTVFYKAAELIGEGSSEYYGYLGIHFSCIAIAAIDAIDNSIRYKDSELRTWYESLYGVSNFNLMDDEEHRIIALLLADIIWREEH